MKAKKMANGDIQVRMTREEMGLLKDLAIILHDERSVQDIDPMGNTYVSTWIKKCVKDNLFNLAISDAEL